MFLKNKDKIVGAIVAKMDAPKKEENEVDEEENEDLEVYGEELLSAIKHRDVPGLVEALKYFINACKESGE